MYMEWRDYDNQCSCCHVFTLFRFTRMESIRLPQRLFCYRRPPTLCSTLLFQSDMSGRVSSSFRIHALFTSAQCLLDRHPILSRRTVESIYSLLISRTGRSTIPKTMTCASGSIARIWYWNERMSWVLWQRLWRWSEDWWRFSDSSFRRWWTSSWDTFERIDPSHLLVQRF